MMVVMMMYNMLQPQSEGESEMEQERLQDEFRDLVAAMDEYLKPIMAPIDTALRSDIGLRQLCRFSLQET